jgi:type III pantothenate kinase
LSNIVIDVGNACIKWARADAGGLSDRGRASHLDGWAPALRQLAAGLPDRATRVLVANVAGDEAREQVANVVLQRTGIEARFARTQAEQLGVRCAYAQPDRLGVDRWVALLAARHREPGPVCVVDAGTAVTFDALAADGRHLGGLIFAGARISLAALLGNTRKIGAATISPEAHAGLALLGTSTDEAAGRGALLALAAGIDRAVGTTAKALEAAPAVLLTGGDAMVLEPWLETRVQVIADLVLDGLALIAEQD